MGRKSELRSARRAGDGGGGRGSGPRPGEAHIFFLLAFGRAEKSGRRGGAGGEAEDGDFDDAASNVSFESASTAPSAFSSNWGGGDDDGGEGFESKKLTKGELGEAVDLLTEKRQVRFAYFFTHS